MKYRILWITITSLTRIYNSKITISLPQRCSFGIELRITCHCMSVSFTIHSNHVGQLVSSSCTIKLNCRIETCRIIGMGQGQLTFRSNANTVLTFHHHHLHSPFGTHLERSTAATTRLESIHSWTCHGVSWRSVRYVLLYFSLDPLTSQARQLEFNYEHP